MKNFVLTSVGLILLGGASASAADMAVKAPRLVAPLYVWNGWYAGLNVGYGGGDETDSQATVSGAGFPGIGAGTPLYGGGSNFKLAPQGVFGGGQVGRNWQTSIHTVFGVETDLQGSAFKDSIGCVLGCGTPNVTIPAFAGFPVFFANDSYTHKIDWFGTARGRVGYAEGLALIYVTGGLAYGNVERAGAVVGRSSFGGGPGTVNTFSGSYDNSTTKVGWTLGVGAEGKLASNPAWSIKGEYLYVDLGTNSDTFNTIYTSGLGGVTGKVAATRTDTSSNRENLFRLGLNYSFNQGGPKF